MQLTQILPERIRGAGQLVQVKLLAQLAQMLGHGEQSTIAGLKYLPAGQATHNPFRSTSPGMQVEQLVLFGQVAQPGWQLWQIPNVELKAWPAMHGVHCPIQRPIPEGQAVQVVKLVQAVQVAGQSLQTPVMVSKNLPAEQMETQLLPLRVVKAGHVKQVVGDPLQVTQEAAQGTHLASVVLQTVPLAQSTQAPPCSSLGAAQLVQLVPRTRQVAQLDEQLRHDPTP